jgi:hypothetical protein
MNKHYVETDFYFDLTDFRWNENCMFFMHLLYSLGPDEKEHIQRRTEYQNFLFVKK